MEIFNEAWQTLFSPDFCQEKYLYHFTDIEKAIKILYSNSLKFSKINNTNDTLESKPKMSTSEHSCELYEVIRHFGNVNQNYIQLLCFTKDLEKIAETPKGKRIYTDYSGRGFALPRMWAQYSKNNTGVCFVYSREALSKLIAKQLGLSLIHCADIIYISKFSTYNYDIKSLKGLLEQVKRYDSSKLQQCLADISFLKNNMEFVKYNYFSKLDDWSGENEFRFLAFGETDYYINEMSSALIGVVVGENIDSAYESILKLLCKDKWEIKKITFSYQGCQLFSVS